MFLLCFPKLRIRIKIFIYLLYKLNQRFHLQAVKQVLLFFTLLLSALLVLFLLLKSNVNCLISSFSINKSLKSVSFPFQAFNASTQTTKLMQLTTCFSFFLFLSILWSWSHNTKKKSKKIIKQFNVNYCL